MKISISNLQDAYPIKKNRVRDVVRDILRREGAGIDVNVDVDVELSIAFVDKEEITRLNEKFLGHKGPTDVLSFPMDTNGGRLSGEVVVCPPVAVEFAAESKTDVEGEIMLYVVHGVLHLLGYTDSNEKSAKKMHRLEKEILAGLGYKVAGI
ncbi:MAG: rRNA maturation RNase YbeY [Planctomycetes bacterium]|nr:rRNA maturation RNase YbeY [Planctomycetota bacterium]